MLLPISIGAAACSDESAAAEVGPASAYVELVLGTSQELAEQQAIRFEEVVAACMAEQGFDYLPTLAAWGFTEVAVAEMEHPPGTREFAEQYGYGFARQPEELTATVGPGDNPNDEIVAEMSPAEVAEYERALMGTAPEDYQAAEEAGDDAELDPARNGCHGRAALEVFRTGAVADASYLALRDEIDRIEAETIPAHPDVVVADALWSECMAEAGLAGYESQPDAQAGWWERFMAAGGGGGEVRDDGTVEGVADLAAQEALLATADWDCADEVGYHDVVARVRTIAQREYVDAHRDELDAWVDRWTEGS